MRTKGNAGTAKQCLVGVAFSMRTFPVVLTADASVAAAPVPTVPLMHVHAPWGSALAGPTSTQLLARASWVASAVNTFSVCATPRVPVLADAEIEEHLSTMARSRIQLLLEDRRAATPGKKDS